MLQLYAIENERLIPLPAGTEATNETKWIDLLNPTPDEESRVEAFLGIDIPTREEMAEIEVSSRLYREDEAIHLTANLLQGTEGALAAAHPVSFILTRDRLITVRYAEPSVFKTFVSHAGRSDFNLRQADEIFAALVEAIIDRAADVLEKVGRDVDALSRDIFGAEGTKGAESRDYKIVISRIGRSGDLNSKVRQSLVSMGRLLNFLAAECRDKYPSLHDRTETMLADIRSLSDHSSYIGATIEFLLDATLGLVNIEQNAVIRILSVVSVVIMPPMLIASVYGMNFEAMPELRSPLGYPLALLAMLLAAVIPLLYFKRRGWL